MRGVKKAAGSSLGVLSELLTKFSKYFDLWMFCPKILKYIDLKTLCPNILKYTNLDLNLAQLL